MAQRSRARRAASPPKAVVVTVLGHLPREDSMKIRHWHPQVSSILLVVALSLGVSASGLAADSKSGPPSTSQTERKVVPKSPAPDAPSSVGTPPTLHVPSATPRMTPSAIPERVPLLPPSPPAATLVPLDGPIPHYSDGAGGWDTKNIKVDLERQLAIISEINKIEQQGSAERDPTSVTPFFPERTTDTTEDLPLLGMVQAGIASALSTVPQEVLLRALRELAIEKLKLPPLPPRPEDSPGTFIKVQPLPRSTVFGRSERAKPDLKRSPSLEAPIPIVPLGPGSSIDNPEQALENYLGQDWNYEYIGSGEGYSFLLGPIGGVIDHPRGVIQGAPSPWGSGPEPTPGTPGQRGVVVTPGGGQPGGSSVGLHPGQGGTLGSPSVPGGGLPLVPGGASQKGGSGVSGGTGGDLVGVRGSGGPGSPQKEKTDGGPKAPVGGSNDGGSQQASNDGGSTPAPEPSGSVPANPYDSVPDNPYGSADSGDTSSTSESTTSGRGGKRA